jgi:hypothetical chaperone protein
MEAVMARPACGMDFGTSNSTLAISTGNQPPRLVPLESGQPTIPTALFYSFDTDETRFGRDAMRTYVEGADGRLLRAIKSVLGTSLFNDTTRVKRKLLGFGDIVATFIAEVKARAEADLGHEIDRLVCGRPVRFVDDDDAADRVAQGQLEAALRQAGYRDIAFQFEPIAAALDYEQNVTREEIGIVADIGGGTSDFTVIRLSPERARSADRKADILSTGGVHVGGTDLDRLLSLRKVMPQLGYGTLTADGKRPVPSSPYVDLATWHRINRLYGAPVMAELTSTHKEAADPKRIEKLIAIVEGRLGHALAARVEDVKIALSDADVARFSFHADDVALDAPVSRDDLDAAIAGAARKIADAAHETLKRAGIGADTVDTLIVTGGTTRVPAVSEVLSELFPAARRVATDAFGSVGLGLAIEAGRRFGN